MKSVHHFPDKGAFFMKSVTLRRPALREELRRYLLAFLLGFGSLLVVILPIIIADGGYYIYYGDYNSQQIPFYNLANDAVRSGSFGWNWYTDLGVNFIGSYAFYLLGSPFFWLTTILPRSWVTFAMPVLLCMKHGIASLTAYAYIRRFVRSPHAAMIGGLLYAFSGFQLFNIFFNHFQDVTAFFPLLLIAMEELVNQNRRGVFALSVALLAAINYFFFTGQVVFLVLYFIVRCSSKDFHASLKKFFLVLLEAVIGVMIACVILLPSALAILANNRVSEHLFGMDMVAYSDRTRIWRILLSLFLIPDVPARPNLFSSDFGKWASIGGYLPMFSMAGVLAFLKQRDGHWAKRITVICAVCACVPILNSAFYALNGSYYARWFYMPILILALMTAYSLDNRQIDWKYGFRICFIFFAAFAAISLLPTKEDDEIHWFSFAEYPFHFYLVLLICTAGLAVSIYLLRCRKKHKPFLKQAMALTTGFCVACTMAVVYFGAFEPFRARTYVDQAIDPEQEISLSVSEDNFFRIDISENCDNYPMLWKLPSMRTFHSVVPASIMDFYKELGITRDVASRADTSYYALRGLLSVEYYYQQQEIGKITADTPTCDLPGFVYDTTENGFYRFKNTAYVPMGFTFDYYLSKGMWDGTSTSYRTNLLMRALVLSNKQIEKYGSYMQPISNNNVQMTEEEYLQECSNRAASACDSFRYDSSGFTATISLESPNLVFFSVPYDEGWTATVNGKPADVEEVDNGFMAVAAEAGDNTIAFHYTTPGLHAGAALTAGGVILFAAYMLICWKMGIRRKTERVCCADYPVSAGEEILPELTAPDDNTEAQTTTPAEDNTGTEETS